MPSAAHGGRRGRHWRQAFERGAAVSPSRTHTQPGIAGIHPTYREERAMQIQTRLLAAAAIALGLSACGRENIDQSVPSVVPPPAVSVGTTSPGTSQGHDPSVPSASSVFAGEAPASTASRTLIQPNATLSDAQEKTDMPMAGQGDSHSSPKTTDKSASSP